MVKTCLTDTSMKVQVGQKPKLYRMKKLARWHAMCTFNTKSNKIKKVTLKIYKICISKANYQNA